MTRVVLTSRVGVDGVLNLNVPLPPQDANKAVRVIIEGMDESTPAGLPMTREEWLAFLNKTAGSITDPTFERPPQGEYEQRDALP
jgi:hypothetical protein